jgi:hypothetical protein
MTTLSPLALSDDQLAQVFHRAQTPRAGAFLYVYERRAGERGRGPGVRGTWARSDSFSPF